MSISDTATTLTHLMYACWAQMGHIRQRARDQNHGERKRNLCRIRTQTRASQRSSHQLRGRCRLQASDGNRTRGQS